MSGTLPSNCYVFQQCSEVDHQPFMNSNESCVKLKKAILDCLNLHSDEHCLASREQLSQTCLCERVESIDELARDMEKLLDQASQGLTAASREAKQHFHIINLLPDSVSFQLNLQSPENYSATIAKVRELQLIYSRNNIPQPVSSVRCEERDA